MNKATDVILAELGRTGAARSVRELVALCGLTRIVVERALGELAALGAIERLLVEQGDHLRTLWRKLGPRARAARGCDVPAAN